MWTHQPPLVEGVDGRRGLPRRSSESAPLDLAGELVELGRPIPGDIAALGPVVGALLDGPRLFPRWTGRYNLQVLGRAAGIPNRRVEACLRRVDMQDSAEVPYKNCSLGMKQRLGVAAALLKDPRLLILDEPGNGLDPAGIHEMRTLITSIASDGNRTVVLSSHQLSEVEQICTSVSIIAQGRLLREGSIRDITDARQPDLLVGVTDPSGACSVLRASGFDAVENGGDVLVRAPHDPAGVTSILALSGHSITAVVPQRRSLEDIFLTLTARGEQ